MHQPAEDSSSGAYEHQLTNLVTGEIDKQLRERTDMLDAMKSQMAKVLREFEDMSWNVNAKRSWMKSVSKASKDIHPTGAVAIHAIVTAGNIGGPSSGSTSPLSRLPKCVELSCKTNLHIFYEGLTLLTISC